MQNGKQWAKEYAEWQQDGNKNSEPKGWLFGQEAANTYYFFAKGEYTDKHSEDENAAREEITRLNFALSQ